MIKVRVVRGFQTGLPIASGLIALSSGLAACTAEEATVEDVESSDSAFTVADPGTGVFELGWAYGTQTGYTFVAKNSTDEYVRAKENMSFSIPAYFLWSSLYPSQAMPNDVARLKQLSATVKVVYYKNGASYGKTSVLTNAWDGDQAWNLLAKTTSFIVSRRAHGIRFELVITDAADPTAKKTLGQDAFLEVPVIGGSVPNKTLLLDNYYASMRQRVLEGGLPVRGADLAIAYTDWRANTLVDSSSIDRQIGTQQSFGRFGSFEMPIYGQLEHEISFGVAIDGNWQAETALAPNAQSRLLPSGRTAYEGSLSIPAGAQGLQFYFHVKTYLKVDYSKFSNVRWRKYQDGERILVREKWDNENGQYADNYDFATEKR